MLPIWAAVCSITTWKGAPRAMSIPKKFFTWLAAMSNAAPAVKPMTTVCEMKLTSTPMRARPRINWNNPVKKVSVSTMLMNSGEPGSAKGLMAANTAMEIAVVGPDTRCQLDPNSAAMMAGSIAAYRPYSGGIPAMVAKATPCGSTISAPVKPAIKSARLVLRFTRCRHCMNGNRRYSQYLRGCVVIKMSELAYGLIIKILRVVGLREEEPALRQQPDVLKYKRNAQQCGREHTERQQGQRRRKGQQQESRFDRAQECLALAVEKFARVKRKIG